MRYLRMLRGDRFPKSCTTITSTLPTRAKRAVMVKVTAISTCPLNEEIVSRLSSSKQPVSLEMPILCCSERWKPAVMAADCQRRFTVSGHFILPQKRLTDFGPTAFLHKHCWSQLVHGCFYLSFFSLIGLGLHTYIDVFLSFPFLRNAFCTH